MTRPPPRSTLFPYTTLFRSHAFAHIHDRAFRPEVPARELVRLRDAHDFAHAVQQLDIPWIEIRFDSDRAEHRVRCAGRAMDVEPHRDKPVDHALDLLVAGPLLHHDHHGLPLLPSPASRPRPGPS